MWNFEDFKIEECYNEFRDGKLFISWVVSQKFSLDVILTNNVNNNKLWLVFDPKDKKCIIDKNLIKVK